MPTNRKDGKGEEKLGKELKSKTVTLRPFTHKDPISQRIKSFNLKTEVFMPTKIN